MQLTLSNGKQINVSIPTDVKKAGIMLSGGMDSALLLYMLVVELVVELGSPDDITLKVYNVPNPKDNASLYSSKIVEYISTAFNKPLEIISVGDVTLAHNRIINEPAGKILRDKEVDLLFSATNQNPPVDLGNVGYPWRRSPDAPPTKNVAFPFVHLYKNEILEAYQLLGQLDLAGLTHSCTESTGARCTKCFQCLERAWAFSQLGLVDNGI